MAISFVCWPVKLTWYNKEINCIGSFWSKKLHSGPDLQKNCIQSLIKCICPGRRIWTLLYPWPCPFCFQLCQLHLSLRSFKLDENSNEYCFLVHWFSQKYKHHHFIRMKMIFIIIITIQTWCSISNVLISVSSLHRLLSPSCRSNNACKNISWFTAVFFFLCFFFWKYLRRSAGMFFCISIFVSSRSNNAKNIRWNTAKSLMRILVLCYLCLEICLAKFQTIVEHYSIQWVV